MNDAIFIIPTPIMLQRVVTAIDKLKMKDRDTKGDVYEYLLSKLLYYSYSILWGNKSQTNCNL